MRRILGATPPAAGPHSRGVGCWVLAVLCWLGWLAGLGWAGDAGKDELGRLGWPGQAGWACLYTFSCFFVVVSLVGFLNIFMLFVTPCSSFGSLRGSIFAPFWHLRGTIWSTRGFPGQRCAHLLGCSEPQGPKCMQKVASQRQRSHFRAPFVAPFFGT